MMYLPNQYNNQTFENNTSLLNYFLIANIGEYIQTELVPTLENTSRPFTVVSAEKESISPLAAILVQNWNGNQPDFASFMEIRVVQTAGG